MQQMAKKKGEHSKAAEKSDKTISKNTKNNEINT